MEFYKDDFCRFLLESKALKIGQNPAREDGNYVLKSGRISPFFMNMGDLNNGDQLLRLGLAYAEAINAHFKDNFDVIFGPAYKGIPLAVATAMQFSNMFKHSVSYCANRKEVKDHGDSGIILGHKPQDKERVVIVEDVTTSGKSINETVPILKSLADVEIVGLVVSFDRMEYGSDKSKTALEEISEAYNIPVYAIVSMRDIMEFLRENRRLPAGTRRSIEEYYEEYGAESIHLKEWRW